MEGNDSFSSTSSTLSGYSYNDESSSFNEPLSSASDMSLVHREDTLSATDSNLDSFSDHVDDLSLRQSGLYDITVNLCIELPKDEIFNKTDILRSAVYTICGDIFFKYEKWRAISSLVAFQMGRYLNPSNSVWLSSNDNHLKHMGKIRITGHTPNVNQFKLPIVHDSVEYSERICATNIKLGYSGVFFLSPGVVAAENIYKSHDFRIDYDACYKEKHMADIWVGHSREKLKDYNHHLAWGTIYNVLGKYRQLVYNQRKFLGEYGFPF